MLRPVLGNRLTKIAASVSAAAVVFALGYAAHPNHSANRPASHNGVAIHASALKAKRAEQALVALLKNSKPSVSIIGKKGTGPTQANIPLGALKRSSTKNATAVGSANWSGYVSAVDTAQEYSFVYGKWKLPKAYCTPEQRLVSVWVGLDGWNSNTVEQVGTTSWCYEGSVFYYTWYEMYPNGTMEIGSTAQPGDAITASVTRTGTSYSLKLTDSTTTGNNVSFTASCALATCQDNSAEWIAERPAYNIGVVPLADNSGTFFSGGATTAKGTTYNVAASPTLLEVTMLDATGKYNLDTVSAATTGSFSVKWVNSY